MLHIEKNYSMYHGKGKEEICYNDSIKEKSPTQSGLGAHNRSAMGQPVRSGVRHCNGNRADRQARE